MIKMATNYARASYSEVYDMHTEEGVPTLLEFSTPHGYRPVRYLTGFFSQFAKFKYLGAQVSFIPAATLPADPLQVSYEAGEPTIDPRDLLNPILHKGIHGNALGNLLEEYRQVLASGSSLELQKTASANYMTLYYQCLTDPSFRKSNLRQGFQQKLYPLVYNLGTNRQIMPSRIYRDGASAQQIGDAGTLDAGFYSPTDGQFFVNDETAGASVRRNMGQARQDLKDNTIDWITYDEFTTKPTRLGWLDTLQVIRDNQVDNPSQSTYNIELTTQNPYDPTASKVSPVNFTVLPKIPMYMCFLPPAYKTEMYFRIVIKHYFEFKDFRSTFNQFGVGQVSTAQNVAYDWLNAISNVQSASLSSTEQSLDVAGGEAELTTDGVL